MDGKMLEDLEDQNIVVFELSADKKTVNILECCDYYHNEDYSKSDLAKLIAELQELHAQMVD